MNDFFDFQDVTDDAFESESSRSSTSGNVDNGPVVLLYLAGAAVLISTACLVIWQMTPSVVGYVVAVAAIYGAGLFRVKVMRLSATSATFAPLAWTQRFTAGILPGALLLAILHAVVVAGEFARRWKNLLGILVVACVGVVGVPTTPAAAASLESDASRAFSEFDTCVVGGGHALVMVLMDESASLRDTDPQNRRVDAVQSTIQRLDALRQRSEGEPVIEIFLAGFGADFYERMPWTRLDDDSLLGILNEVPQFADRNSNLDTDYYNALDGAQSELDNRSDQLEVTPPCQILFWITDGVYSIEQRSSSFRVREFGTTKDYAPELDLRQPGSGAAAIGAGVELLCQTGGVSDRLRSGVLNRIAVTLTNPNVPVEAYDLVQALVTGSSSTRGCGSTPTEDEPRGGTISVDNPEDIVLSPGTEPVLPPYDFVVSSLSESLTIEATWSAPIPLESTTVRILTASGADTVLSSVADGGPVQRSEGHIERHAITTTRYSNADGSTLRMLMTVELDQSDAAEFGTWSLGFSTEAKPTVVVTQQAAFGLEASVIEELRAGEPASLFLQVVGGSGEAIENSELSEIEISAVSMAPGVEGPLDLQPHPSGTGYLADIELPADFTVSSFEVEAVASPVDSDSTITPVSKAFAFAVAAPAGFPTISSPLPMEIEGAGTLVLRIQYEGDVDSDGCVVLEGLTFPRPPPGAGQPHLLNPSTECIPVAAGSSGELEFEIEFPSEARGVARADLDLTVFSAQSKEPIERSLALEVTMRQKPSTPVWIVLAIAFSLIGGAVPYLLLLAMKERTADYQTGPGLWWLEIPVLIADGSISPRDQPSFEAVYLEAFDSREGQWLSVPPSIGGYNFDRKLGLSPLKGPTAFVEVANSVFCVGSAGHSNAGFGDPKQVANINFALRRQWILSVDAGGMGSESETDARDRPSAEGVLLAIVEDEHEFDEVIASVQDAGLTAIESNWPEDPEGGEGEAVDEDETVDRSEPNPWPGNEPAADEASQDDVVQAGEGGLFDGF